MVESPPRELGDDIALDGKGDAVPRHRAGSPGPDGEPIAGASVDVWQANEDGFYDVQQPGVAARAQPARPVHRRRRRPVLVPLDRPALLPDPDDGPVGELLAATGRHPYRPAHLHFIVAAPGYPPVTTHVFVADSPYLDSDAVFGVKESLIRDVAEVDDPALAAERRPAQPVPTTSTFDRALLRQDQKAP